MATRRTPPSSTAGSAAEAYGLLFDQVDNMACTLDLEGRFVSVNQAGERLTGYTQEDLLGTFAVELIAPELRDTAISQFRKRLAGGERTADETMLVTRDGERVPIEITSTVFFVDGRPAGVLGLVHDLTERKNAAEALRESEQRFRSSFESAAIGMALVAPDGRFLQVNESLCDLVGYSSEELVAKTFQEITHPDDLELDLEYVRQMLGGELRTYQMEKRYFHRLGDVVWILLSVSLVRTSDGGPLHFIAQIQDITESKRAEEALKLSKAQLAEAEQRYRTLVEQLPLGTYVRPLDMSKPNIYASPQVEPMLGYTAAEWESNPELLASIIHPDDRERALGVAQRVRKTGEPIREEYRYVARDGRTVWVQDETHVACDEHGEPTVVQGFLLDITQRKLAEAERDRLRDELGHAQRLEAIGRLAGGVAHDFNNMLTAIKGYGELLRDQLEPESPEHEHAAQILRAADQASALPKQLLAFGRKQALAPKVVDLNDVVSTASRLLKHVITEAVELVTVTSAGSASSFVDPTQMEHVLVNLALNAKAAMPGGGRLTIATANVELTRGQAAERGVEPGSYVVLSVTDTGQGMDAETKARAFEPFFTTRLHGEGSGLGLASVYGTVTQSGGFIELTTAPGQGATFEIHFPCVGGPAPAGKHRPASPPAKRATTALVVEDEVIVRELAANVLAKAGFDVHVAANGEEALELWAELSTSIDVLVTDMVMPGVGGRELAERIRELNPSLPVVFMSGYTEDAPPTGEDLGAGMSFLHKPFFARELVGSVRKVLNVEPEHASATSNGGSASGLTCVVADDHPAVLDSTCAFLEKRGFEVSRASRGDEALRLIDEMRPSIALLDVGMQPLGGIEIVRQAARTSPETRSVLFTGHRDQALLEEAIDAGARGFVLKEAPLSELERALAIVAAGGTYADPDLSGALASKEPVAGLAPLTPREREILILVADGLTNEKVGSALSISPETVQSHVRNTMAKLDADTRTEAVATALRHSIIR